MILSTFDHNKGTDLFIIRSIFETKQIRSRFVIFNADNQCIFSGVMLELAYLDNFKRISAIPAGCYPSRKINHHNFGKCINILQVREREGIFVHSGNYNSQIQGCLLPGQFFKDLNNDQQKDVVNSRICLDDIYQAMQQTFYTTIVEARF